MQGAQDNAWHRVPVSCLLVYTAHTKSLPPYSIRYRDSSKSLSQLGPLEYRLSYLQSGSLAILKIRCWKVLSCSTFLRQLSSKLMQFSKLLLFVWSVRWHGTTKCFWMNRNHELKVCQVSPAVQRMSLWLRSQEPDYSLEKVERIINNCNVIQVMGQMQIYREIFLLCSKPGNCILEFWQTLTNEKVIEPSLPVVDRLLSWEVSSEMPMVPHKQMFKDFLATCPGDSHLHLWQGRGIWMILLHSQLWKHAIQN